MQAIAPQQQRIRLLLLETIHHIMTIFWLANLEEFMGFGIGWSS